MLNADENAIKKIISEKIANNIIRNRNQKIPFKPGYDGVYGVPIFDEMDFVKHKDIPHKDIKQKGEKIKPAINQKGLNDFM